MKQACAAPYSAAALAKDLRVGASAVAQWKNGERPVPPERCVQIEQLRGVPRWDLRPHDWYRIWPELIRREGAPLVPAERCVEIEEITGVMRWDLRPHDWYRIWPELISAPGAPAVPTPAEKVA